MKYDVTVVGAGPAGAHCAKNLAERGLKVLILDKKKFPRNKHCGGLVSRKALNLIKDDSFKDYIFKANFNPIFNITLTTGEREVSLKKKDFVGVIVKRKEFDEFLTCLAIDKGANFMDNCEYEFHTRNKNYYDIHTTGGIVSSDYLIGADGVFSRVARVSGLRQRFQKWEMGLAVCCEITKESVYEKGGIEFTFPKVLGGMGWCFSGSDFVNIGVGGYAPDSKRILHAANELVVERLKNKRTRYNLRASFLPAGGRKRKIANERIFLVGDAAGFVDAFSGEGIYYALTSGRIVSETIYNNEIPIKYEKQCYRIFLDEFRLSVIMSLVLGERNKVRHQGVDKNLLEAFDKILRIPPEKGCYKEIIYNIIRHGISPIFPYLWMRSLIFA